MFYKTWLYDIGDDYFWTRCTTTITRAWWDDNGAHLYYKIHRIPRKETELYKTMALNKIWPMLHQCLVISYIQLFRQGRHLFQSNLISPTPCWQHWKAEIRCLLTRRSTNHRQRLCTNKLQDKWMRDKRRHRNKYRNAKSLGELTCKNTRNKQHANV